MTAYQNIAFSIAGPAPTERGRRILLADDDEVGRCVLAEYLEQEGYQVQQAADGRQALAAIASFLPDLIIVDVKMPELDGLEVVRRVHARSTVPIIILSALSDDIDRVAGLSAGSDDYVTKPVQPRELLLRIQALLRRADAAEAAQ